MQINTKRCVIRFLTEDDYQSFILGYQNSLPSFCIYLHKAPINLIFNI